MDILIPLLALAASLAVLAGGFWLVRRRRYRRSSESEPQSGAPPSFHRQLTLIVLPVVGLATAGMVALYRDQAAVEADARQRAAELAVELTTRLSRAVPQELSFIELAGNIWDGGGVIGPANVAWSIQPMTDPDPSMAPWGSLAWVHARYPLPAQEFLPLQIHFLPGADLARPPAFPAVPVPPVWTRSLTGATAAEWERLRLLDGVATNPSVFTESLASLARQVPDPQFKTFARFQEEFATLRLLSTTTPVTTQVRQLLALVTNAVADRVLTASGVPLGVAAFAEARRWAPSAILDAEWFEALKGLVLTQPSLFTPWLLDQAEHMTTDSSAAIARSVVAELRAHWESDQRRRALATRLQQQVPLTPPPVTNLWLTQDPSRWFFVVQPTTSRTFTSTNGHPVMITNQVVSARVASEELLGQVFHRATEAGPVVDGREQRRPPVLPSGLKLAFELEGHSLTNIPASWAADPNDRGIVLAVSDGEFQQEAESGEGRVDHWPSRPRFTVRVLLSDPAALFAAQRRQQWLFGGLMLATAGVAGLGVWQASRAFHRQLALNEQKSNFVSGVSHELRAPLASMRLLAEGLASGRITEDEKRREYAGFLVQETRRLGSLVENVLDFARIEQGRKRYEFEPTDVSRLVQETCALMKPLAEERKIRIESQVPVTQGALTAHWDGRAVQQALLNLLDNALKHAPEGTAVTVSADRVEASPTLVRLTVRDHGPGIPPEDHARIFERFYRRGSELRRETQGIGLGLAIVQHIVTGHGGRVTVESEEGRGAAFVVEMPGGQ